jgi:hypothetical protein
MLRPQTTSLEGGSLPPDRQNVVESPGTSPSLDRTLVLISVVLLVLFAAAAALLWRLGVFDAETQASNAQVLAAALGLVGVLVTAALTFVGVLLKHSIDARTLQQTAETEGRLRLETSIRAVELLTEEGKPATPTRQAGALFVLANLNQLDFAFALLGQMWANREIGPGAATWVINRLLLHGDPSLQAEAAVLLYVNAETLATPAGYEFPQCVNLQWKDDLSQSAREFLVSAFGAMILAKKSDEWDSGDIGAFVTQLDVIRKKEQERYIRNGAVSLLGALLEARPMTGILYAPDGVLDVDEVMAELNRLLPEIGTDLSLLHDQLAVRIRTEWAQGALEPVQSTESAQQ